jgi:hypothetical protein
MRRAGLLVTAALGLLSLLGCDPRQALFFLQPFEPTVPPPCTALRGKRVVVITKVSPAAMNDYSSLDREINREVVKILAQKCRRIELVDTEKVWTWDKDHPTWTDPAELATAFDADAVVFLEVNAFQIQSPSSPGMFEGHSSTHIRVVERAYPKDDRGRDRTDKPKETSVIYDADRDSVFPTRGPMPISAEVSASAFKARFLGLVANEISWNFVDHAPGDDIQDVHFR